MIRRRSLLSVFALVAALEAHAEFGGVPDRWQFLLGGQATDFVTEAAVNVKSVGAGATLSFEDLFNIPGSQSAGRLDGFWRFSDKGYVDFGYVQFNRSGSRILTEDVTWKEYTIAAGTYVTGTWDSRFPYAAYRHDFLQEEKVKISGSAGFSYLRLAPRLEADGGVTGPTGPVTGHFDQGVSVQFPVPLIGLRIDWVLHNRLAVEMFMRFFYLNYQDFEGGMRESAARLKWHFSKHVGAGVGYESTTVRLKSYETGDYDAKFLYELTGLSAFLTLAF